MADIAALGFAVDSHPLGAARSGRLGSHHPQWTKLGSLIPAESATP